MRPRRLLTVVIGAVLGAALIAGTAMAAGGGVISQWLARAAGKAMEKALHAKAPSPTAT
jgi:hypothetical protein